MAEHNGTFVLHAEVHLVVTVDDVTMPDPACSTIRARITAMLVRICDRVVGRGGVASKIIPDSVIAASGLLLSRSFGRARDPPNDRWRVTRSLNRMVSISPDTSLWAGVAIRCHR